MNTRVLMSAAVAAVCLTGFAVEDQVAAANTFGVLKIASSSKRLIIGIPWCACSTSESDVSVIPTNLVLTTGLSAGDSLHYIQSDWVNFDSWRIEGSGDAAHWVAGTAVSGGGVKGNTTTEVPRGHSMMLMRSNPDPDSCVYLSGQLGKAAAGSTTIAAGAADAPAFTLLTSPGLVAWNPNSDAEFTNAALGDELRAADEQGLEWSIYWLGSGGDFEKFKTDRNLTKCGGVFTTPGWYVIATTYTMKGKTPVLTSTIERYNGSMPVCTGFWYVSRGGDGKKVSWK